MTPFFTWPEFIESVTPPGATTHERRCIARATERLIRKNGVFVGDLVYWFGEGHTLYGELHENGWVKGLELTPALKTLFEREHAFRLIPTTGNL